MDYTAIIRQLTGSGKYGTLPMVLGGGATWDSVHLGPGEPSRL